MSVALPETDGRIFSTVVGFKQEQGVDSDLQFRTKYLVPEKIQISHVAELTANWVRLRKIENSKKRVAIILANYPNKDSRLGNGVGLDTPASVLLFLEELKKRGYLIESKESSNEESEVFKDRIMFEIKLRNINKYNISLLIRIFDEISKFKDLIIVKVSFLWNNKGDIITSEPFKK